MYVDNFLVIGSSAEEVQQQGSSIRKSLEAAGYPVHETVECDSELDFIGLHLDGSAHEVRLGWRRIWRMRLAIRFLLERGKCSGLQLERVIGHLTWAAMLRRESLSVLSSCYSFSRQLQSGTARLWPTVRRELRQFAALLPLLCAEIGLPWDSTAYCSDSSDTGYAVLSRDVGVSTCSTWGRLNERWRFDYEDAVKARSHALGDPTLIDPVSLRPFDTEPFDKPDTFDEIHKDHLDESDWKLLISKAWTRKEDILKT